MKSKESYRETVERKKRALANQPPITLERAMLQVILLKTKREILKSTDSEYCKDVIRAHYPSCTEEEVSKIYDEFLLRQKEEESKK